MSADTGTVKVVVSGSIGVEYHTFDEAWLSGDAAWLIVHRSNSEDGRPRPGDPIIAMFPLRHVYSAEIKNK